MIIQLFRKKLSLTIFGFFTGISNSHMFWTGKGNKLPKSQQQQKNPNQTTKVGRGSWWWCKGSSDMENQDGRWSHSEGLPWESCFHRRRVDYYKRDSFTGPGSVDLWDCLLPITSSPTPLRKPELLLSKMLNVWNKNWLLKKLLFTSEHGTSHRWTTL